MFFVSKQWKAVQIQFSRQLLLYSDNQLSGSTFPLAIQKLEENFSPPLTFLSRVKRGHFGANKLAYIVFH